MQGNTVPINALTRHIAPLQDELAAAITEVVASGHYVLGPSVAAFERAFATYCGVSDCIGVGNGTDALELALRALGIGPGHRVVLAANAAMYSTSAVLACGATPVFTDIVEDGTLDPAAVASVLAGASVQAVIVTHLYGQLARIDEIAALCRTHSVSLIEDCAQAHGAKHADGRVAGSFGDLACFSFYPTKNLGALGDGGAVVTSNAELGAAVRQLRQYGWSSKYVNAIPGGRNSRLDELQARALLVMLPHLDRWNARRRDIANRFSLGITNTALRVPRPGGEDYVAHLYVVHCERRDELQAHLTASGIQTDIHYPVPDHRQPCHGSRFQDVELPFTDRHSRTALTLPCFPELTDEEVERVIKACNAFR